MSGFLLHLATALAFVAMKFGRWVYLEPRLLERMIDTTNRIYWLKST